MSTLQYTFKSLFAVAVCLSVCRLASAQNLVQNPGFETGDFTDWTISGNTFYFDVYTRPHSGSFDAEFGNYAFQGDSVISQVLPTTPGVSYNISFWYKPLVPNRSSLDASTSNPGNHIELTFGGNVVFNYTNFFLAQPTDGYVNAVGQVTATSSVTTLRIGGYQSYGWVGVDDVSVTASSSSVPEPGVYTLLGSLCLAAGFLRRRRK